MFVMRKLLSVFTVQYRLRHEEIMRSSRAQVGETLDGTTVAPVSQPGDRWRTRPQTHGLVFASTSPSFSLHRSTLTLSRVLRTNLRMSDSFKPNLVGSDGTKAGGTPLSYIPVRPARRA